jgi:tetratricopeptide (TPR) repeat protein
MSSMGDVPYSESNVLASKPWRTKDVVGRGSPFGMLGIHESNLLYFLARDYFRGAGVIVDAGSFLGRSAWCFAQGVAENRTIATKPARVIHCFDNFIVNDQLTVEAIRRAFGLRLPIGSSTRRLFDSATAPVAEWLDVHEGDFHVYEWRARPIEILLVDIAKSASLNQRLVETMFPLLIPGRSIVVHQDYHHPWLPYLHATMELLHDYFEVVEPRTDDSAAFLLTRPLPAEAVRAAAAVHTLPLASRLALMDAAIERLPPDSRCYVQLARAHLLGRERGYEAMRDALATIDPTSAGATDQRQWVTYRAQMQAVLDDLRIGLHRGWQLLGTGDVAGALAIAESVPRNASQFDDAQVLRVHCLRRLGRLDDASRLIDAAISRRPSEPMIWVEKAWLAFETQDLGGAEAAARRGLELASANRQWRAACLDVLACALTRQGEHDEAIALGAEAVATLPDAVWIREHHASSLLQAGRLADAEQVARKALALAPDSDHARRILAAAQRDTH